MRGKWAHKIQHSLCLSSLESKNITLLCRVQGMCVSCIKTLTQGEGGFSFHRPQTSVKTVCS